MSIVERQSKKLLEYELIRYLLLGSIPNLQDISSRIGKARARGSNITYKYVPQQYKAVFNTELYNKALNEIKFDIDVFNEELTDLFIEASNRLNYADIFYRLNSGELDRLSEELNLLLFINNNADFYFSGFLENFSSNQNTDIKNTTEGIVDLNEQALALPYRGRNTKRIDVGSLSDQQNIDITVQGASNGSTTEPISIDQIPNSKFGSIFTDALDVWGYKITSSENSEVSIAFTFPLNIDNNISSEFFVSRFEVTPHSTGKQRIDIRVSNDNVNFLKLKGYEAGIELTDSSKTYALDFETNLVEYVRIVITKSEADNEIRQVLAGDTAESTVYEYVFGLKRFAAFQTGRIQTAEYFSKPIEFSSLEEVGKVSIDAVQTSPPGTKINYFVSPYAVGQENNFVPISLISSTADLGKSKVVFFNNRKEVTNKFIVRNDSNSEDAAVVYGTSFQGKQFYRIGPGLSQIPQFETSKLFRGFNGWHRDTSGLFEILEVNDNYVPFEQSDLENVYTLETEQVSAINQASSDGVIRKRLQVSRPPYYDSSRGHALKPQPGVQDPLIDVRPNYAIYRILHNTDGSRQTRTFTLASSREQYLPVSNFVIQANNQPDRLPRLALTNGTTIYQEGTDYTFELIDIGGQSRPTGRISIPAGSAFLDTSGNVTPLLLEFSYVIDPDITHKVSSIQNNNIILDHCQNTPQDSIEIIYRYVPVAPSSIIRSSVRVSNLPTTSNSRTFYVEGRDYSFDPGTGAIQRIPTGDIGTTESVYVQFSYRGASSSLQTFTTWAYVASDDTQRILFDLDETTQENKLVADDVLGESFYINTREGIVNLTTATSTPILPSGWIQLIVRSKDPDANQTYGTNLIDQVIQLKDINNKKIFRSFNLYFNEITAFREPLQEVTLNSLKVNTLLSNHNVFAIDSITDPFTSYIVLNFEPNQTTELYLKVPTEDSDETNPPDTVDESFMFVWLEKQNNNNLKTNKLVVKIELSRSSEADGGITPKCQSYQLRVGP